MTTADRPTSPAGGRPGEHGGSSTAPGPAISVASQSSGLGAAALLAIEAKFRSARTEPELLHAIANELRKLVAARQIIIVQSKRPDAFEVVCVSSLVLTERETPFTRWISSMMRQIVTERGARDAFEFDLPAFVDKDAAETRNYPFSHFLWQPLLLNSGEVFAGLLVARERPWTEQDRRVLSRESEACANAWQALFGGQSLRPRRRFGRKARIALAAAAAALALAPVPMTTLAPVEIVARTPQRVTAPIDGVVQSILIDANRNVSFGEPIIRFEETTLRNRLELAEQERLVAKARYERAVQASFVDEKARHELAQARAELDLKQAERDFAHELLSRTVVKAERSGVLVYTDKDRWIGRPVRTGERMMQIVDPNDVVARVEVPVADAIVLDRESSIRLFLDASPLTSVPARIVSEGYHAEPNSTQQLVYRVHAEITEAVKGLRIGARGTAQLRGGYVPLAFYLLRRPISAARQHIGL